MTKVKMTDKGTIVLPKSLRDERGYTGGTEFEVIDGGRDIVLKPIDRTIAGHSETEKRLTVKEFIAKIPRYNGPPVTDEMIKQTVLEEAGRRWDRLERQRDEQEDS